MRGLRSILKVDFAIRLLVIATLSLASAGGQNAKPKDSPPLDKSSGAQFTSRTELVVAAAIVTDGLGGHLLHLKREDFSILEDGVEQKIAVFEEVTTTSDRPRRFTVANQYRNYIPGQNFKMGGSALRLTILALDLINTRADDQVYARAELFKYLAGLGDSQELVSVVALTRGGIRMIHDFTDDPKVLAAAVARMRGSTRTSVDPPKSEAGVEELIKPTDPMAAAEKALGQLALEGDRNDAAWQQAQAASTTLLELRQLANAYAGVPGRKSLMWITGGFPFSVSDPLINYVEQSALQAPSTAGSDLRSSGRTSLSDILPAYERLWRDMNNAQMALYPVDVRGLEVVGTATAATGQPTQGFARQASFAHTESITTMQAFADLTGGKAYYNTNDLRRSFAAASKDSESYYLVGYYLDRQNTKPGWHKLTVRARGERVKVRARSGFYLTANPLSVSATRQQDLSIAAVSPLDYTAISFTASWEAASSAAQAGLKRIGFKLAMLPSFTTIDETDSNHFLVDFVAVVKSTDGQTVGKPFSESLESHLKPESVNQIRSEGLTYRNALELPPGDYTVRFVVRDGLSGRMGSVVAPLKVE